MNQVVGLQLEPLDVLFFRDARPFAPATRGTSLLPRPQTLAGAVWTALMQHQGCDFDRFGSLLREARTTGEALREAGAPDWLASVRIRGPWLARKASVGPELDVLVPVPAVLQTRKAQRPGHDRQPLRRLRPRRPEQTPGWVASLADWQTGLWPLWLEGTEPAEPASGYLTPRGLRDFLAGRDVSADELVPTADLFAFDHRTGIGIDPQRLSAQESLIYAASFLALRPGISLYVEVELPAEQDPTVLDALTTLTLGGERRRAAVSRRDQPFHWAAVECPPRTAGQKPLLLATTPALFSRGWKPSWDDAELLAAAVPGHEAVSGWDLVHGGPKPNRFAVPAGSTYYFDRIPDNPPPSLSDEPEDQRQGWGCYLTGVWNA